MIIGLGGTNGAGKDTVAQLLVTHHNYLWVDATGLLVNELHKRGWPTDREHKSRLSAEWRRQFGMGAIVDMAMEAYQKQPADKYQGLVVSSLRHPGEVDRIHEAGGIVIWIDADPKIRYERITRVKRDGRGAEDDKTFEAFLADEQREMTPEGDGATLNMAGVKEKADTTLWNEASDTTELLELLNKILITHK